MKSYNTTEAIGTKLDELVDEVENWADPEPEDVRRVNLVLAILKDRAALIKNNVMEQKLDELESLVKARLTGAPIRRVV